MSAVHEDRCARSARAGAHGDHPNAGIRAAAGWCSYDPAVSVVDPAVSVVHPARFTPAILEVVAPTLDHWRLPVHDPFAGTGERLGRLCDQLRLDFSGTEIEAEFIVDPRVAPGDSTDPTTYPTGQHCVVTSPTYGNGINDHFHARDGGRRHTYRQALANNLGHDRPLAPNNTGRYAVVRGGTSAEVRYWRVHRDAVGCWPPRAIVNVSDFVNGGETYPLVARWVQLLAAHGYAVVDQIEVATPRQRHGSNGNVRCGTEVVLVCERA